MKRLILALVATAGLSAFAGTAAAHDWYHGHHHCYRPPVYGYYRYAPPRAYTYYSYYPAPYAYSGFYYSRPGFAIGLGF